MYGEKGVKLYTNNGRMEGVYCNRIQDISWLVVELFERIGFQTNGNTTKKTVLKVGFIYLMQ